MKTNISAFLLAIAMLATSQSSFAFSESEKKDTFCQSGNGEVTPESISGLVKCSANTAVISTALFNLYKVGANAGKEPEERSEIEHSIIKTYHESVCLGDFSDSVAQSFLKTQDAADSITRDQGLPAFLSSVWELQKKRVEGKTWRKDFIPKLAGKGFESIAKATTGEDTLLKDLTAPVEIMTKYSLAKNVTENEKSKDRDKIVKKIRCGKVISKVIDGATGEKRSVLTGVLSASKSFSSMQSKAGDYLMYIDMATLLAMNGGALGDKLIENTISPSLGSMGSWTLSQKAKAAQMGLKLKKLIDKIKHHSPNTKGKMFQKSESGKALAAQTQDELEQKLKKANDEYHELNSLVNEVVREGEDIAAPQSIKDYASHLKFYWAKVRHKRDAQVAIMKERTRKLLCLAPDATLSEKQVEEKYSVCSEDDMTPKKKPILERAKDKAKSLWTRFKNRKNGD